MRAEVLVSIVSITCKKEPAKRYWLFGGTAHRFYLRQFSWVVGNKVKLQSLTSHRRARKEGLELHFAQVSHASVDGAGRRLIGTELRKGPCAPSRFTEKFTQLEAAVRCREGNYIHVIEGRTIAPQIWNYAPPPEICQKRFEILLRGGHFARVFSKAFELANVLAGLFSRIL